MNLSIGIMFYIVLLYMIIECLKDGDFMFALIFILIGMLPFTH